MTNRTNLKSNDESLKDKKGIQKTRIDLIKNRILNPNNSSLQDNVEKYNLSLIMNLLRN